MSFEWVATGVVTVIGSLATAVLTLWKRDEAKNTKRICELERRVQECEDDRGELRVQVGVLATRLGIELPNQDGSASV